MGGAGFDEPYTVGPNVLGWRVPVADGDTKHTVDVIDSNCLINLSGDKRQVLKEAFACSSPAVGFAVSDVITREGLPAPVKESMALWTGCVAGALEEDEFIALLREVGFENPAIEPTRIYTRDDAAALSKGRASMNHSRIRCRGRS